MYRSAVAELPLHPGKAPPWLFQRMVALAREIFRAMAEEFSPRVTLERLADPFWFQALSMLLGFDWHSSGTTTVTCGALAEALKMEEHGIAVLGGKGGRMRRVPPQIEELVNRNLLDADPEYLKRCSRLVAKVDTAAIQDGYPLYHHTFFVDEHGNWAVVQQGMNSSKRMARRYHWISGRIREFSHEPHTAIVGDGRHSWVLDLTSSESEGNKKAILDMLKEGPGEVRRSFSLVRNYLALSQGGQATLDAFYVGNPRTEITPGKLPPFYLQMPFY
ncbi:MAG: DUF763 domain-containing protein, partial [Thermoplasmata archaeon]|nr:DUF763 domain-containing protein [Thermoplasmata archaeon]